jgi:RNA polymerase sigma-70 factor (ECF subfamily)
MGRTDEELVEACLAGEESAFDVLLGRWEKRIRGAIYRLVGSDEEARDLCQEAFLKAYKSLRSFKQEARFSSWLYQIALNLCRDRMRRRRGKTMVSLDELEEGGAAMPVAGPTALDLLQERDTSRLVAQAIEALPDEQREVIILKEYQGLTFLEIAQVLDVPISTVKTRLYRGLDQLRARLEREGFRGTAPLPAPTP